MQNVKPSNGKKGRLVGGSYSAVQIDEYVPYLPALSTSISIATIYLVLYQYQCTSYRKNNATRKEAWG